MDNNTVIGTLTIYGDSLKKLYKVLPENCIKTIPSTKSDGIYDNLEVKINDVIFTGKDDNSYIVLKSYHRNYTKEELIVFQKIAIKCFTYPFGALGFTLGLNVVKNDKSEAMIRDCSKKNKIETVLESLDSEGHIELTISDVRDFSKPSFIDFVIELQTFTNLLDEIS